MGVSLNGGTQQPCVFLLKMIILGCFGGTIIFGNIHIYHVTFEHHKRNTWRIIPFSKFGS